MRNNGSILVGLLWCLALLSVLVVGILHGTNLELRVAKNHGDLIQAHYLALAGVEKAKALLYQDATNRKRSRQNHTGELYDAPEHFRDVPLGRGQFRVIRQGRPDEGGQIVYGISDEESRLNLNHASAQAMGKLYQMTPEIAAAVIDYRDSDQTVTPGGAEAEDYAALRPPYLPRDGQFRTVRELLMVRDFPRDLFLGEDLNGNGLLDPEEDDGDASMPQDNRDGILDAGWSGIITVHSSVRNVNAAGESRINVQEADESTLVTVPGITSDIAKAIVAYRGDNRLENIADLLDVTAPRPAVPNAPPPSGPSRPGSGGREQAPQPRTATAARPAAAPGNPPQSRSPQSAPQREGGSSGGARQSGPKVIDEDLLIEIADDVTAKSDDQQGGAVNINTAPLAVLICLPGIDEQLAQAIINYRQSAGFFANIASVLKVPGFTRNLLEQLAPHISVRSETFRILSEGKVGSTGARKRIQVTVRVRPVYVDTLAYREDL